MSRSGKLAAWLTVGSIILFLFAPVFLVVVFSFNDNSSASFPLTGLSTRWYNKLLANPVFWFSLKNSVLAALITVSFVLVAGTAAALALMHRKSRVLDTLSTFIVAPLIVPGLFLGVALFSFFTELGIRLSLWTAVVSHSLVTLPLVVLIVNARLAGIDRSIVEAARDLGASGSQAFWKVLFPLIYPALAGASMLVIAWSMDEVILTLWTSGADTTIPVMIWSQLRRGTDPSLNAAATITLAVTIGAAFIATRFISTRELVE